MTKDESNLPTKYEEIKYCKLFSFWSKMNSTFVILVFTLSLIAFISCLDSSFALQYSNYTSQNLLVQFQYPLTWDVMEKNRSLDLGPTIQITDPFLGLGYIYLAFTYEAKNSFDPSQNIQRLIGLWLQTVKNDSSTELNMIEHPSYLTIDGRKAGTITYMAQDRVEDHLVTVTKVWIVLAEDGYYILGFGTDTDTDLFSSPEYTEIQDRFIDSIKFLKPDISPVVNSTNPHI